MDHITLFIDIVGWIGAALIVAAYFLVSTGRTAGTALGYQLMNAAGSVLVGANAFYFGALPSAGINVVWLGIAIAAIVKRPRVAGQGRLPD